MSRLKLQTRKGRKQFERMQELAEEREREKHLRKAKRSKKKGVS